MAEQEVLKKLAYAQENLVFGDGLRAIILKRRDGILKEGKEYVRFALRPSESLIQKYNLQDSFFGKGYLLKEYESHLVHTLYQDPHISRETLVLCGFNNEPTVLTKMHQILLYELERIKKENWTLKAHNIILQQKMVTLCTRPDELIERSIRQFKKIKGITGKETIVKPTGEEVET